MKLDILKLAEGVLSIAVPEAAPFIGLAGSLIDQPAASAGGEFPDPLTALAVAARIPPPPVAPPKPDTHLNADRMAAMEAQIAALLERVRVLQHAQQMHLVVEAARQSGQAPADTIAALARAVLPQESAREPEAADEGSEEEGD